MGSGSMLSEWRRARQNNPFGEIWMLAASRSPRRLPSAYADYRERHFLATPGPVVFTLAARNFDRRVPACRPNAANVPANLLSAAINLGYYQIRRNISFPVIREPSRPTSSRLPRAMSARCL